jgi:hypothetical protein
MVGNFAPFLTLEEAYSCLFSELGHIEAWMPDREQFLRKIWDHLAAGELIAIGRRCAEADPVEIPVAVWDTRPEWSGFKIRRDDVLAIWGRGPIRRPSGPLPNTPWPVAGVTLVHGNACTPPAHEAKGPPSAQRVSEQELGEFLKTRGSGNADVVWREAEAHFKTSIDRDRVRNHPDRIEGQRGRPRGISK